MSDKPATRLYVESDLSEGGVVGLSPDHAHFLRSVLRLEPGRWVTLFNGRDGEWAAKIDGMGKGWASLAVGSRLREQSTSPDVWLYFAPIKRARLDFLVQKATELGVRRIQPVVTQRTIVERVKGERLTANVTEAAEQCERLDLPEVCDPIRLDKALDEHPSDRTLVACVEFGDARPIARVVSDLPHGAPVTLLIGPEGGFTLEERKVLESRADVRFAGLGPRILRAETAGLAALTVWQALAGDWSETTPERY